MYRKSMLGEKIITITLATFFLVAIAFPNNFAFSEEKAFPTKPIAMVVPYSAGGATDMVHRIVGGGASESLGVPIIILNKPGAGSTIGGKYVAKAKPDGYTLGSPGSGAIAAMAVRPDCPYTIDDFTPNRRLVTTTFIIFTKADAPWKNLKQLIYYVKQNPGKLTYSSAGVGTSSHLGFENFKMAAGLDMAHVPFKGDAPTITAVLGGHINVGIAALAPLVGHLKQGTLRALTATALTPPEEFPNMSTLTSEGYPEGTFMSWHGVVGPKGFSRPVTDKLYDAYSKALMKKGVVKLLRKVGITVTRPLNPEEFGKFLKSEYSKYSKVAKKLKIEIK